MPRHPYRRHRIDPDRLPEAHVSESDNIRALHLGSPTIQSAMNIDQPSELVLAYSRVMMAWLLFRPDAQHITQIGLGGGAFCRWLDEQLPHIHQSIVEINAQVIHIAQTLFELPFESDTLEIIHADGAQYIKTLKGSTDIILADGFDGEQIAPELVSETFFADCHRALSDNGIFASNLWQKDKRYPLFLQRLMRVFNGQVLCLPAEPNGNTAVFAFKNHFPISKKQLEQHSQKLKQKHDLDFPKMLRELTPPNGHNWAWYS